MCKFVLVAFLLLSAISYADDSSSFDQIIIRAENREIEKMELKRRSVLAQEEANRLKRIEIGVNYIKD